MFKVISFDCMDTLYPTLASPMDDELVELIRELKKEYKIALMTSLGFGWGGDIKKTLERDGVIECFDYISCEERSVPVKPEKGAFIVLADKLGVSVEEVLHIGDSSDRDVVAAQIDGCAGLLFTGVGKLKEDLKSLLQ